MKQDTDRSSDKHWFIYMIRTTDNLLYTGITTDMARRWKQHSGAAGGARFFRGRKPAQLVYLEKGHNRSSASRREAAIKKLRRSDKLSLLTSSDNHVHLMLNLFPMDNCIQPYDWGSKTALNDLFAIANPDNQPQAEIWMGAHPAAASKILLQNGEFKSLDAFIKESPEAILGDITAKQFAGKLPYLFKVLSAAVPLSIQVHPNKQQAEAGYEKENQAGLAANAYNRNYRDDNHKPELIYALTPFRAMCGFRRLENIVELFSFIKDPLVSTLLNTLSHRGLQGFWQQLLELEQTPLNKLIDQMLAVAEQSDDPAIAEVKRLNRFYPGDAGVFSPMILNVINMKPGQAMYLDAGTPHAYLDGTGLEIMANSDNVLHGGLTSKYVDTQELLSTINFTVRDVSEFMVSPDIKETVQCYPIPVPDFAFSIIPVENHVSVMASGSVEILFCIEGSVKVILHNNEQLSLKPGTSCLVTAIENSIQFKGRGRIARATVNTISKF